MKRTYYKRHVYCGHKVNPKRSRAGLLRYHESETASRKQTWRDESGNPQETQPQPTTSSNCNPVPPQGLKEYKAVHKSKPSTQQQEAPKGPRASNAPTIAWPPRDPEVEKHELTVEVEKESPHDFDGLDGYRIVDIKHVLNWAMNLQTDHSKKCTYAKIKFLTEKRDGLTSIYIFQCFMCKKKWYMSSEKSEKINKSFVWSALTAASYYSQSTHMLAIMDIPAMSADKFKKIEVELGKIWQEHLWEEMQEAAKQEREIAVKKGHVSPDGVPYICVYVDGGWCKRTYGHNFNASSGVACIIGVETKKCLFLGIKNKYCNMCAYNEKKGDEKKHLCFRNYEGSSTAMEADILVEGFSKSVELYGLRFTSFVGDGDSAVFARLKDKVPYGNIIKKKECKNHVMKNYTSALYKISGDTKLPLGGRKMLGGKLKKLTTVARLNLMHNSDNVAKMRQDLKNGPLHVFGQHNECDPYYCRWKKAEQNGVSIDADENMVPELKKHVAVWALIETAIENIVRKADRLLGNLTNNVAENFMSLMAKYNCGKRINLSRGGSYHRRAQIAHIVRTPLA